MMHENLYFTVSLQHFIRHSAEFLCRRVFQYLKEPISSLLFFLLHRMNITKVFLKLVR